MTDGSLSDCLEARIERFLRDKLGEGLLRVSFVDESDGDGDPILVINIVTKFRPEPARLRGVARDLILLMADETDSFPVLFYRAPEPHSRSVRAAA